MTIVNILLIHQVWLQARCRENSKTFLLPRHLTFLFPSACVIQVGSILLKQFNFIPFPSHLNGVICSFMMVVVKNRFSVMILWLAKAIWNVTLSIAQHWISLQWFVFHSFLAEKFSFYQRGKESFIFFINISDGVKLKVLFAFHLDSWHCLWIECKIIEKKRGEN